MNETSEFNWSFFIVFITIQNHTTHICKIIKKCELLQQNIKYMTLII